MGFNPTGLMPDNITIVTNINGQLEVSQSALVSPKALSLLDLIRQRQYNNGMVLSKYNDGWAESYEGYGGSSVSATSCYGGYFAVDSLPSSTTESDSPHATSAPATPFYYEVTSSAIGFFSNVILTKGSNTSASVTIKDSTGTITYVTKTQVGSGADSFTFTFADYNYKALPIGTYRIYITGDVYILSSHSFSGTYFSITNQTMNGWYGGGGSPYACLTFTLCNDVTATKGEINHTLPSGTLSATCDSIMMVSKITLWETGDNIKFKLKNATEDTGWLTLGNSAKNFTFTAFTSEPTTLIVKLIPKTSSPTMRYPTMTGIAFTEVF